MVNMRTSLSQGFWALASLTMIVTRVAGQATPTDETDGQPTSGTADDLRLNANKMLGCYSDPGDMIDMGPYTFQALGWCQPLCVRLAKPYLGLVNGTNCFCGDNPPSSDKQVDPSNCQASCAGINTDFCGGTNNWAIYSDGYRNGDPTGTVKINIPTQAPALAMSGAGTSSHVITSTALVTQSGGQTVQTVFTTQVASPAPDSSSGPNKVAIAVGVVVAVIVVAALVGALFFWMRYRKNKAIQDERMRHQMMTSMVTGEKPGSSYSLGDSRLDQGVMFQRRQSDGSIADNEDYSRRILKVTNPDGR